MKINNVEKLLKAAVEVCDSESVCAEKQVWRMKSGGVFSFESDWALYSLTVGHCRGDSPAEALYKFEEAWEKERAKIAKRKRARAKINRLKK